MRKFIVGLTALGALVALSFSIWHGVSALPLQPTPVASPQPVAEAPADPSSGILAEAAKRRVAATDRAQRLAGIMSRIPVSCHPVLVDVQECEEMLMRIDTDPALVARIRKVEAFGLAVYASALGDSELNKDGSSVYLSVKASNADLLRFLN